METRGDKVRELKKQKAWISWWMNQSRPGSSEVGSLCHPGPQRWTPGQRGWRELGSPGEGPGGPHCCGLPLAWEEQVADEMGTDEKWIFSEF